MYTYYFPFCVIKKNHLTIYKNMIKLFGHCISQMIGISFNYALTTESDRMWQNIHIAYNVSHSIWESSTGKVANLEVSCVNYVALASIVVLVLCSWVLLDTSQLSSPKSHCERPCSEERPQGQSIAILISERPWQGLKNERTSLRPKVNLMRTLRPILKGKAYNISSGMKDGMKEYIRRQNTHKKV